MARLSEYDEKALLQELGSLLQSLHFLKSKILITEELKSLVIQKYPKGLAASLSSDQSVDLFTQQKAQRVLKRHFENEWTSLRSTRRRIGYMLENGDIDILDCGVETRDFWKAIWTCIRKLPNEKMEFTFANNYVHTDFSTKLKSQHFPDECIEVLADFFVDQRKAVNGLPKNMKARTRSIINAHAKGATHDAITQMFGISASYSRKIKSEYQEQINRIQQGEQF